MSELWELNNQPNQQMDFPITMFGRTYDSWEAVKLEYARQEFEMSLSKLLSEENFTQYGEEICKAKPEKHEGVQRLLSVGANPEVVIKLLGLDIDSFEQQVFVITSVATKGKVKAQDLASILPQKKESINQKVSKLIKQTNGRIRRNRSSWKIGQRPRN